LAVAVRQFFRVKVLVSLLAASACERSGSTPSSTRARVAVSIPAVPTQVPSREVVSSSATFERVADEPVPPRAPGSEPHHDPATQDVMVIAGVALRITRWTPSYPVDRIAVMTRQGSLWKENTAATKLITRPLVGFVPWKDGALVITSPLVRSWATGSALTKRDGPGCDFIFVGPSGAPTRANVGIDPHFTPWEESDHEGVMSLVGTVGVPPPASAAVGTAYSDVDWDWRDIVVVRRTNDGKVREWVIVHGTGLAMQSNRTHIAEFGSAALVWPTPARDDGTPVNGAPAQGGDESAWRGKANTIFLITDQGVHERVFRSVTEQDCSVATAALVGDDVFAVVECPSAPTRLTRIDRSGARVRLDVPSRCEPQGLRVKGSELTVRAVCASDGGPKAASFRLSKP